MQSNLYSFSDPSSLSTDASLLPFESGIMQYKYGNFVGDNNCGQMPKGSRLNTRSRVEGSPWHQKIEQRIPVARHSVDDLWRQLADDETGRLLATTVGMSATAADANRFGIRVPIV